MSRAREAAGSAVARFAGSVAYLVEYLGLAPQALCFHLLRRFSAHTLRHLLRRFSAHTFRPLFAGYLKTHLTFPS